MREIKIVEKILRGIVSEKGWDWPAKAVIEPSKDPSHGDAATNIALVLAKQAKKSPKLIAEDFVKYLTEQSASLFSVEIAGPGFINFFFTPAFWQQTALDIFSLEKNYGSSSLGNGRKVLIEYVSANPTGPLHIGHGRGAAVGDSLKRLLRFAGYDVSTEYYINDAGRQMRLLGDSVFLRMQEILNLPVTYPDDPKGWYHGDYIKTIAREILDAYPKIRQLSEADAKNYCYEYACNEILQGIKKDLQEFRVEHQVFASEKYLVDTGKVDKAFQELRTQGLIYDKDNAIWLATEHLGDDKDRVLRKSDGYLTYFATDIAYHADKFARGFDECIDVWGADHHGYIPRMNVAIKCMGHNPETDFHVVLIQMVNLLRNGEAVAMSTRAGEFVTLREIIDEVGVDATRYMFLSRKSDSPLDFDLELVKQRTMDNPVYYVQYAYARIQALLRRAARQNITLPSVVTQESVSVLTASEDISLLRAMERFSDVVESAAQARTVHPISAYLQFLAGELHSYYTRVPILSDANPNLVIARLLLLSSVGIVISNGLNLMGLSAPETM